MSEHTLPPPPPPSSAPEPRAECECMTANELARFLGVNRKTVYDRAARKEIPCRRLGRRFVFSRTAILAWLARSSVSTTADNRA
jgi:excisionase family DNA binding protein